MRLIKIIGALVGVIVLIVIGLGVYVSTLDFNQYKERIAAEVKKATGRDLVIKGTLDVGLGLSPSVVVNDVTFQNASWGSRPEMAKIKKLELEAQLIPLLSGTIKVTRLVLNGADIVLETDKAGRGNWDMAAAGAPGAALQPKPAQPAAPAAKSADANSALPQIDKITIKDSTVTYRDGQTQKVTNVQVKSLNASGIGSSGTSTIDLDAVMNNAPLSLKAEVSALKDFIETATGTVDVHLKLAASSLNAKGNIANGQPNMIISASGDNLANLKPLIGVALPPLGPYSLNGKLSAPAKDTMRLDIASLKVGSSQLTGDIAIGKEANGKPKLVANLNSPKLDIQDFNKGGVGPGTVAGGGSKSGGDGRVFPNDPLPVDDLRQANAALTLKAGEIFNGDVRAQNLVLALSLVNGRLNVKPTANVSGGTVAIDFTLDASQGTPQMTYVLKGQRVNIGDLMKMLQNSDAIKGGPADVDINVRGAGPSIRAIMASLNGQTSVSVAGGTLNNKSLAFVNADVMKLLGGTGNNSEIKCIVSRFTITDGFAKSQVLGFDLGNIYGTGKGDINLKTEGLNMEIDPKTRQAALGSLAVPIDVKGTLANPSVVPDVTKGAGQLAKGLIDKPKDIVGGVGGGLTGGLLGGKSKQDAPQQQPAGGGGGCGASTADAGTTQPGAPQPAPATKPAQKPASPTDRVKGLFR